MTSFKGDGYPFLKLARHYNVDYGYVLSYSDYIDSGVRPVITTWWQSEAANKLPIEARAAVIKVCKEPKEYRHFP